jgi:arylsulfatase A-like enzyme
MQNIDLIPTLLELNLLPIPKRAQKQSLLPLLASRCHAGADGASAFAERTLAPITFEHEKNEMES